MKPFCLLLISFFTLAAANANALHMRTTNMNQDIVIRETLFNALTASAGTVQYVTANSGTVSLFYGNDSLVCNSSKCTLTWDSVSPGYNQAAGVFESSLDTVLENWATGPGANDPATHRTVFVETNSDQIIVSGDPGSRDFVKCTLFRSGTTPIQTCSLILSDYSTGSDATSEKLFNSLSSNQNYVNAEIQSELNLVSGSNFLPLSNSSNQNGLIQITRTTSTDLLVDELSVSKSFAYVTPILNSEGLALSDGISITLVGTEDSSSNYDTESVRSSSYAISAIIP